MIQKSQVLFQKAARFSTDKIRGMSRSKQKEEERRENKMAELVEESKDVILKVSGVFPFDFFPDELVIEKNKVNYINRYFFWSGKVRSVLIENIEDITIETSPFFASLEIEEVGHGQEKIALGYIWKEKAKVAREVIQGLIICKRTGIKIPDISSKDLIAKLQEIGSVSGMEKGGVVTSI